MIHQTIRAEQAPTSLPTLSQIATKARLPDPDVWALLTKPGPLTEAEWAHIEELERGGR